MHCQGHRPQPTTDPVTRDHKAADNSSNGEHDDADRAVDEADRTSRQRESAGFVWIKQKWRRQLQQLRFGKAIEQQERKYRENLRLAEEINERNQKSHHAT